MSPVTDPQVFHGRPRILNPTSVSPHRCSSPPTQATFKECSDRWLRSLPFRSLVLPPQGPEAPSLSPQPLLPGPGTSSVRAETSGPQAEVAAARAPACPGVARGSEPALWALTSAVYTRKQGTTRAAEPAGTGSGPSPPPAATPGARRADPSGTEPGRPRPRGRRLRPPPSPPRSRSGPLTSACRLGVLALVLGPEAEAAAETAAAAGPLRRCPLLSALQRPAPSPQRRPPQHHLLLSTARSSEAALGHAPCKPRPSAPSLSHSPSFTLPLPSHAPFQPSLPLCLGPAGGAVRSPARPQSHARSLTLTRAPSHPRPRPRHTRQVGAPGHVARRPHAEEPDAGPGRRPLDPALCQVSLRPAGLPHKWRN